MVFSLDWKDSIRFSFHFHVNVYFCSSIMFGLLTDQSLKITWARFILLNLRSKYATESNTSASDFDLCVLLSIGRGGQLHTSVYDKRYDFNFHITIFRAFVAIFHIRPHIAFSSHSVHYMPGIALHMDVLF